MSLAPTRGPAPEMVSGDEGMPGASNLGNSCLGTRRSCQIVLSWGHPSLESRWCSQEHHLAPRGFRQMSTQHQSRMTCTSCKWQRWLPGATVLLQPLLLASHSLFGFGYTLFPLTFCSPRSPSLPTFSSCPHATLLCL